MTPRRDALSDRAGHGCRVPAQSEHEAPPSRRGAYRACSARAATRARSSRGSRSRIPASSSSRSCSREHAGPAGRRAVRRARSAHAARCRRWSSVADVAAMLGEGRRSTRSSPVCRTARGGARRRASRARHGAARIVDLSSDHRDGCGGYVYGLPEAFRAAIARRRAHRQSRAAIRPRRRSRCCRRSEAGWLGGPVMVSALSGVSGAGRAPALRTSFVELDGGAALYKAGTEHAHVRRDGAHASAASARADPRSASRRSSCPWRAASCSPRRRAARARPSRPKKHARAYAARYASEPFVRLLEPGTWPETRAVRGLEPLRRRGHDAARRPHAARHRGDRQPGEGRRRPGDPEPQPHARAGPRTGACRCTGAPW